MFLTAGRRAAIVWRQAGDPYIPATLAPRDHHRRLVSRGRHARSAVGYETVVGAAPLFRAQNMYGFRAGSRQAT